MAEIIMNLRCNTAPLREVMAELSAEEMQRLQRMVEAQDDRWLSIGDPEQDGPSNTLVFTIGLNREALASA